MVAQLRRAARAASVFLVLLFLAYAAPAQAKPAEPGKLQGGSVVQEGWWSKANEPAPETGLVAPPSAPAAAAPKGTLPVAVVNGEQERVSAIQLDLQGKPNATVSQVELALRESAEPGAQLSSQLAQVSACPVTEASWVGTENGAWKNQPTYDCDAVSAPGERSEDGVWTFDLTLLASEWLSPSYGKSPAVVLVGEETGENKEPLTFQVAFDGMDLDGIGLVAQTGPPSETAPLSPPMDAGSSGTPVSSSGAGTSSGVGSVPSSASAPAPGGAPVAGSAAGGTEPAPAAAGAQQEQMQPAAAAQLPWYAGLGKSSALLLPLVLVLTYLLMLANGPSAQPVGGSSRRGVSKALDRMRAAGAQVLPSRTPGK